MTIQEAKDYRPDITLNLRSVLNDLVADGRLSTSDAETLSLRSRTKDQLKWHPIELIAEQGPADQKNPAKNLDLETLTHWLLQCNTQLI